MLSTSARQSPPAERWLVTGISDLDRGFVIVSGPVAGEVMPAGHAPEHMDLGAAGRAVRLVAAIAGLVGCFLLGAAGAARSV